MALEDTLKSWGAAPSATELQKMENAEAAIRKAIKSHAKLSNMDVSIIRQGSYRAKTNVKQDSDVDICVCLNHPFYTKYPDGKVDEDYGNEPGSISFSDFRELVHEALNDYFDEENITPGKKAFDIHSNTYRVDADVVAALAYRYYRGDGNENYIKPTGISFFPRGGNQIINWPDQTYGNNLKKHEDTGRRYRKMVRIIKRLRNKMQEEKINEADNVGSFLIESLVWNVPDEGFNHDLYKDDLRYVLAYCFNETQLNGNFAKMREVNNLKLLFGDHQPWTRESAHEFLSKAWDYIGFK